MGKKRVPDARGAAGQREKKRRDSISDWILGVEADQAERRTPRECRKETRAVTERVELLRNDRPGPVPNPVKAGDSVEGKVFPPEYRVTKRTRKGQVEEYRYKSFHYDRETALTHQESQGVKHGRRARICDLIHYAADDTNTARMKLLDKVVIPCDSE